jgi:hypothetical protein
MDQRYLCNTCKNFKLISNDTSDDASDWWYDHYCKVWDFLDEDEQRELRGTYMSNCSRFCLTEEARIEARIEEKVW